MEIKFLGAAQTVTGSQHVVSANGSTLMMECGLYQGRRQESMEKNRTFEVDLGKLNAVLLSHAHIDHSGNLPNLVKSGYTGPIYATPATAHLVDLMLRDSGHVQETVTANINYHRARKGEPPIEPLYTEEDATQVEQYLRPIPLNKAFEPAPGIVARFIEAGHILGSAAICLDVTEKRRTQRVWFSGDIGRRDLPLMSDPVLPDRPDYLVMECTYGDKPHRSPEVAYEELREVVSRTLKRGGKVVIPAFAVGRTQELVYDFQKMIEANEIPRVPVIVDSPLAVNASDLFRAHADCFDEETQRYIHSGKHQELLGFDLLTYTRSVDESKALNERKDPMIIISASGMAETGRILYHIRYAIEDARNTILIVSWQAPFTLGRRLADREKQLRILGETFYRRAEVATIGGLSAHAGQDYLIEYAQAARNTAKKIFLVHGEPNAAEALRTKLVESGMTNPIAYPEYKSAVEL